MEAKGNDAVCGLLELYNIYIISYNIFYNIRPKAVRASG
jgi:hypothetical protein